MEDHVYTCKWKRIESGFRLWVKGEPRLSIEGDDDIHVLSELLSAKIAESGGAFHAVLEFDKPFPKSAFDARYCTPELLTVCGDDRFEANLTLEERQNQHLWSDQFFEQPSCSRCRANESHRNDVPFQIDHLNSAFDGGFISVGRTSIYVFSSEFIEQLTEEERASLHFRPIALPKKSKKSYFELAGPAGVPFVRVSTLEHTGASCKYCGFTTYGYWSPKSAIRRFVAASSLPGPIPSLFTVGSLPGVKLCVTAKRWAELNSNCGTRGFTSSSLGVAPDSDVVVLS